MKLLAFIPARLESKRLPNKIIKNILNFPMIEHVIRRVLFSNVFERLYIVSNNSKIKKIVPKFKNFIIKNKKKHFNGTSRVSEISNKFSYDYAAIIFADEPFIDHSIFKKFKKIIKKNPKIDIFNLTTNLNSGDLESKDVVKVILDKKNLVIDYFRKKKEINSKLRIVKSCGVLVFKKKILDNYNTLNLSYKEKKFKIEQFKFLDNNLNIKSIFHKNIKSSINTYFEFNNIVSDILKNKKELKFITTLKKIEFKNI